MDYGNAGSIAALSAGLFVYWLIMMALCVVVIIAQWKIFVKAGRPGWGAIVPIYNCYLLFDIAMGNGILFLLLFVPCANVIAMLICMYKLGQAFGKDTGFCIGLMLLSPIFLMILAFSDAQYQN